METGTKEVVKFNGTDICLEAKVSVPERRKRKISEPDLSTLTEDQRTAFDEVY